MRASLLSPPPPQSRRPALPLSLQLPWLQRFPPPPSRPPSRHNTIAVAAVTGTVASDPAILLPGGAVGGVVARRSPPPSQAPDSLSEALARVEAARLRRDKYRQDLFRQRWGDMVRSRPLRGGCVESRFDIGCQLGPISLSACVDQCEAHRNEYLGRLVDSRVGRWRDQYSSFAAPQALQSPLGGACGAIGFYEVTVPPLPQRQKRGRNQRAVPQSQSGNLAKDEAVGFCQLKATFCTMAPYNVRFGNCTEAVRWARGRWSKRGWCTHLLGPLPHVRNRPRFAHRPRVQQSLHAPCAPGRDVGPINVALPHVVREWFASAAWRNSSSTRWLNRQRAPGKLGLLTRTAAANRTSLGTLYLEPVGNGQIAVLGGGLNNMLMGLAQLLTHSCARDAVLLMPPLDADPLRDSNFASVRGDCFGNRSYTCSWTDRPKPALVPFSSVFDLGAFVQRLSPELCHLCHPERAWCPYLGGSGGPRPSVASEPPPGARIEPLTLEPLNSDWKMTKYARMLSVVYRALQPSASVRGLIAALGHEAQRRGIGSQWTAVHLPIEKDWWWGSSWCHGRKDEMYTRRCYSPEEVARNTREARRNASGTVLMYAFDKVARRDNPWTWEAGSGYGPPVCRDHFGENTFKLQLPAEHVPYTFRNAAELFFAASAPRGFFGNSYSTFSKGVALMRAAAVTPTGSDSESGGASTVGGGGSYAYDCAGLEWEEWQEAARANIVAAHPGFRSLRPLSNATMSGVTYDDHCNTAFNSPELVTTEAALEVVRRYRMAIEGRE